MQNRAGDRFTQRMGTGMITAAWLVVLIGLTVFFSDWLDQRRNPNREVIGNIAEDGVREVRLQRNRSGHYVSTGYINGRQVEFLLDTGATHVAVPASLAIDLGLTPGVPISYHTANGTVTGYTTIIDRVRLGNIELHDVRAGIMPDISGEILLGMAFLKDLEFSQRGETLTLRQYPQ